MEPLNLELVEISLKKRAKLPYNWFGVKQTDAKDSETNFIYNTRSFSQLTKAIASLDKPTQNYALNRWYNFWSASAIEQLFAMHKSVVPNINLKHKFIDFSINEIPFDHKSSVFPKGFGKPIAYAKQHPKELINWLYANQSNQGRKHFKNRLFMIFYDHIDGNHWKLKCEVALIKNKIDIYLTHFNIKNLYNFNFDQRAIFSDIIWIENSSS